MGSQQCSELMHANDGMGVSCKDCSISLGPDLARKKAVRFFQNSSFCQDSLFEYIILRRVAMAIKILLRVQFEANVKIEKMKGRPLTLRIMKLVDLEMKGRVIIYTKHRPLFEI